MTRDRLPSLIACLESYAGNCRRHARSPDFVVSDDSPGPEAADRTKVELRRLATRCNARVRYAGRQDKSRFADALAAESGVSREIISFALFGDERCPLATGANRNSLLLDAAGALMLSVDDDTLCQVAAPRECETAQSSFPGYDPTAFWFFPDRTQAIQSLSFVDADVLGCHEEMLGRAVDGTGGRVAMTLNGLAGDSGMASPRYYLTLTGASRDRLVASEQAYRSAMESREVLRSVRQPTVTPGPFCMTTFLGLDNRDLLPPFFPVQRNSDGIFGLTLSKCLDSSHVAFLPWILLHLPDPPRAFAPDEIWADAANVRMADIVIASIMDHQNLTGDATVAARLADLGEHLRWLGSLDYPDFEARLRAQHQIRNFTFLMALHSQLHTYGASPNYWADDVNRMIEMISRASSAADHLVPRDLRQGCDAGAARLLSQELVAKYGEVLVAWPAMVAAAKRVRDNESRLAEAV